MLTPGRPFTLASWGPFIASLGAKKEANSQNRPIWMKIVSNESHDNQVFEKTVKCIKSLPFILQKVAKMDIMMS